MRKQYRKSIFELLFTELGYIKIAGDGREQVVQIMGLASGQPANGFHFLSLVQQSLQLALMFLGLLPRSDLLAQERIKLNKVVAFPLGPGPSCDLRS